jgi:hypothetical protein
MDNQIKFNLALIQIDNLSKIVEGNEYEHFFVSHLLPMKFEFERQLALLKR